MKTLLVMDVIPLMDNAHHKEYNVAEAKQGGSRAMGVVHTSSGRCKKCYSCIRNCPVKAIKVENEQSQVIDSKCISCGSCVKVCKQNAKQIDDGIAPALRLLESGERVAACIAPSFPAEFHDLRPGQVFASLRAVGFDFVAEVSVGAGLIAGSYLSLLRDGDRNPLISSACSAIVNIIEVYYPQLISNLAPVASPMVALARYIKAELGEGTKVVFIGPCLAKKSEILSKPLSGDVDCVMTFEELHKLLDLKNISVAEMQPDYADLLDLSDSSTLSVSGGLSYALGLQGGLLNQDFVTCEGPENCIAVLDDIATGKIYPRFVDLLFCDGCIDGPGMTGQRSLHFKRHIVASYVKEKRIAHSPQDYSSYSAFLTRASAELDLSREFDDRSVPTHIADENIIETVLRQIGKQTGQELNCGACGYDNCRDMASAICQGIAEVRMCLPHLIDELDQANIAVMRNNDDLQRVLSLGRSINSTLSLEKIIDAVETSLQELFDCDDSSSFLRDTKTDEVIHSSCSLDMERVAHYIVTSAKPTPQGNSQLGKGAIDLSEVLESAKSRGHTLLTNGFNAVNTNVLFAPIVVNGECAGVMVIERRQGSDPFQTRDYRMLELLGDYVSNAVANALAYQQILRLTERLESLNELTKSVARSLDLESALRAIAENLEKVLDADVYHLSMIDGGKNYIYLSPEHLSVRTQGDSLVPYSSEPGSIPLLEIARSTNRPVVVHFDENLSIEDRRFFVEHRLRSVLTVPVRTGGELIAIISFGYITAMKPHVLAEQFDRVEKAAEMLGLLIANARAFRDTSLQLTQKTDELEQAIAKARQAEKLALLGKMASIVAHDLRTPVSSLGMSLYSLRNKLGPHGTKYPELTLIEDSVVRLKEAMENLLDFSRAMRVRLRECDVNALVKRVVDSVALTHSRGGVQIEYRLKDGMPLVKVDETHLERALVNLVLNAIQASQIKGGKVRITTDCSQNEVTISVADDGPGIPEELRSMIFEPFYTTKDKGTGLGLVVVKKVAEAHGGSVEVQSSSDGARFTLRIPITSAPLLEETANGGEGGAEHELKVLSGHSGR